MVNDKVTSDHMPILGDFIIGFENSTSVGDIRGKDHAAASSKVYGINGTLVSDTADDITKLPNGIYIFNGKKVRK